MIITMSPTSRALGSVREKRKKVRFMKLDTTAGVQRTGRRGNKRDMGCSAACGRRRPRSRLWLAVWSLLRRTAIGSRRVGSGVVGTAIASHIIALVHREIAACSGGRPVPRFPDLAWWQRAGIIVRSFLFLQAVTVHPIECDAVR